MINYFKKIDLDLSNIDIDSSNSFIELNRPYNLNFTYYKIHDYFYDKFKSSLPNNFQKNLIGISYCIIKAPFYVYPHMDKFTINVINYYHQPGNAVTCFYKAKNTISRQAEHDGVKMDRTYHHDDIVLVDRFKALKNECYILNVSKIHDVTLSGTEDRHFINFAFSTHL